MNGALLKNNKLIGTKTLIFIQKYPLILFFGIMAIALSFGTQAFATTTNLVNLVRQLSVIGILAVGQTFVMIAGGFDLSIASVNCLTAIVVARLMGFGLFPAIFAGLALALFIGFLNGVLISKAKVNPFVVTLGMMAIARGFALVISGGYIITQLKPWYKLIGNTSIGPIPTPVFIFLIIIIIGFIVLKYTLLGRYIYSVGGSPDASRLSGINTDRIVIITYSVCSFLAGLSGIVLASRLNSASPNQATGYELDAIAAVIVGGTKMSGGAGNVLGTILGVFIIGIIGNGLLILKVEPYWQDIVKGVIIIVAVSIDVFQKARGKVI